MFHKKKIGLTIRCTSTVFYSLVYLNSRQGFHWLKYMYSVISVIVAGRPYGSRTCPIKMPFQNLYTANTNHLRKISVRWKSKTQLGWGINTKDLKCSSEWILNGGEILVNWSNREPQISRYLPIQIRIQILVEFDSSVSRGTNSNPDFGLIWIWSSTSISNSSSMERVVPHNLVRRIRFWRIKCLEQDFKYLYWTISKSIFWNLFTCR